MSNAIDKNKLKELMPKSKLTRISLIRLFHDIETKGITTVLNELESV